MLKYTPKSKKTALKAVIFPSAILLIADAVLIAVDFKMKWIWQLSAIIFLTIIIQLTTKYILSSHSYLIGEDSELIITKKQGKKETVVCNVKGEYITELLTKEEYKKRGVADIKQIYNYCNNFLPPDEDIYYCIFDMYGEKFCVSFEPSSVMVKIIYDLIKSR